MLSYNGYWYFELNFDFRPELVDDAGSTGMMDSLALFIMYSARVIRSCAFQILALNPSGAPSSKQSFACLSTQLLGHCSSQRE